MGWEKGEVSGIVRSILLSDSDAYLPCADTFTTKTLIGIDPISDYMWVVGSTSLTQYTSQGTVASTDKTQPGTVTAASARKMLAYGGNVYISAIDSTGPIAALWQALTEPGNTIFTWTKVLSASAGATSPIGTAFNAVTSDGKSPNGSNEICMLYGEYSDPVGGPQIWRSTDGVTWVSVFGPVGGLRHFHCIKQDPYYPSNVYATAGDGDSKVLYHSSDYGVTWSLACALNNFQGVQISFTPEWIMVAGDSTRGSVMVYDRATLTPKWLPGWHRGIAVINPWPRNGGHVFADGVTTASSKTFTSATAAFGTTFDKNDIGREVLLPGAIPEHTVITAVGSDTSVTLSNAATASNPGGVTFVLGGDEWFWSGFYGIGDPTTGFFYFVANDNSSGGNRSGLFVHTGQQLILLESFAASPTGNSAVSAEHYIYAGMLWMAGKSRPLLTASFNTFLQP